MPRWTLFAIGFAVAVAMAGMALSVDSSTPDVPVTADHGGCPDLAALGAEDVVAACPAAPLEGAAASPEDRLDPALLSAEPPESVEIVVYTTPTCGCCHQWIDGMTAEGLTLRVEEVTDILKVMDDHGIDRSLVSCHTSMAAGYFLQGHMPADAIRRLLRERPAVKGLAVVGMPLGAPGMGGTPGGFDVLAVAAAGSTSVYAAY